MYRGAMPFKHGQLAELVVGGMAEGAAHTTDTVAIEATEGAVVLSQAEQRRGPFAEVARTLTDLIRGKS
jgi:hypothetical protein